MSEFSIDFITQPNGVLDATAVSNASPLCGTDTDPSAEAPTEWQNPDEINHSSLPPIGYMPNQPPHNAYLNAIAPTVASDQCPVMPPVLNQNMPVPQAPNVYYNAIGPTAYPGQSLATPAPLIQGVPSQYYGQAGPVISPVPDFRQYYNWPLLHFNANNFYYNLWPQTFANTDSYIPRIVPEVPNVPPSYYETVGLDEAFNDDGQAGVENSTVPQSSDVQANNIVEVNPPATSLVSNNFFNQSFLFPAVPSMPESSDLDPTHLQTIKFLPPTLPADRSQVVPRRTRKQISYAAAIQGFSTQAIQPVKVNDPNQSYMCQWNGCGEHIYGSRPEVNHHLKMKHFGYEWADKKLMVKCLWPLCSTKPTIQLGNLAKHITDKHLLSTLHQCALCSAPVSRPENIDRHLRRYCSKVKEYQAQARGVFPEGSSH